MRRAALPVLGVPVLAGPTILAFFTGGYFEGPRAWAGLIAWAIAAVALACGPGRAALPADRPSRVTLTGLAGLAVWSLLSITWAPLAGDAYDASQIVVLYLGALLAAALVLRQPVLRRSAEPVLALGATVVIVYGLVGRLLPGIVHLSRSVSAQGRLEQPLTYWNAMGELAALGLTLALRLAGDPTRPRAVRVLAVAAAAPLGVGLYASFSRGALFAAAAGVVALVALAPRRAQLFGLILGVSSAAVAAIAVSPLHGVTSLQGSLGHREHQGLVALIIVLIVMAVAALAQLRVTAADRDGPLRLPPHPGLIATALVAAGLVLAIVVGNHESSAQAQGLSGGANRLVSLASDRYAYWHVALRAFAQQPLHGVGAGNWGVYWLKWRHLNQFASDAHSLELQTLAELGLVGIAALAAFLGGVVAAAVGALRRVGPAAAGPVAALVVYLVHSPLDWDWEMPAVTLVAIALAGLVMAQAGDPVAQPGGGPLPDRRADPAAPAIRLHP